MKPLGDPEPAGKRFRHALRLPSPANPSVLSVRKSSSPALRRKVQMTETLQFTTWNAVFAGVAKFLLKDTHV
jgi:hypothetical protein